MFKRGAIIALTAFALFAPSVAAHDASPSQERDEAPSLDALLVRLAQAESAAEAQTLESAIQRSWARSGSETADLLAARGAIALKRGEPSLAIELYDRVVILEPSWAEGFAGRARARTVAGDFAGARSDLETAVRLEPRRFDALAALAALEERAGRKEEALRDYQRALAIAPLREEWRRQEERLQLEIEGHDI